MNEKSVNNLKPFKSAKEAKEKGRAGGKASGEAKRRKKSMQEAAKLLLGLPVQEKNKKALKELNIDSKDADNQILLLAAMLSKAINGNVKAAVFLRDTAGEMPMSKQDIESNKIERERLKLLKEKLGEKHIEESEDDGFLTAIAGPAVEDWSDE